MTYDELLKTTADKKAKAIRELNSAIRHQAFGFFAKAELESKPGSVAWLWLAKDFCEAIANNIDDLIASVDSYDADDICRIYQAYYNDDPDLYELLPVEAQLFD